MNKKFANNIFTFRSYAPVPFLILMLIFAKSTPLTIAIGFLISLLGECIRFWGVSWAGSETRTTGKVGGTFLVISGPFAYVRNPLYVGNMLMYSGFGVMSFALIPYLPIIALLWFVFQYYVIVIEEESFLKEKFGEGYQRYVQNVPRFFPRLTPYRDASIEQPDFEIKAGMDSERRTLQAFAIVTLLIIIRWFIALKYNV